MNTSHHVVTFHGHINESMMSAETKQLCLEPEDIFQSHLLQSFEFDDNTDDAASDESSSWHEPMAISAQPKVFASPFHRTTGFYDTTAPPNHYCFNYCPRETVVDVSWSCSNNNDDNHNNNTRAKAASKLLEIEALFESKLPKLPVEIMSHEDSNSSRIAHRQD
jgi:hypothetical protein